MRQSPMKVAAIIAAAFILGSVTACTPTVLSGAPTGQTRDVVRVPADASLTDAGSLVADGGIILISPGTYTESLDVRADDVTVRGEDRNGVVLDGRLKLSNGVVATGERVTVENLTVRNFLQNGVLVTGVTDENGAGVARGPDGYLPDASPPPVPGYLVQYVTAENNGLYGIYAFNRTDGVIQHNLASGGSDSGIYVGQCETCNAIVQGNVVEFNAAGIELANASSVALVGNRIVRNRIGVSVLSNYLEAHGPTKDVQIAGNLIADNDEARTPVHAGGAFGIGLGLGGTVDAIVQANTISGNDGAGVWITSSEDFAPTGTTVAANRWDGNGLDVALAPSPSAPGSDNCFALGAGVTTVPAGLGGCTSASGAFAPPTAPKGVRFSDVEIPADRPGLDAVDDTPRTLPHRVRLPSLDGVQAPGADLLADGS